MLQIHKYEKTNTFWKDIIKCTCLAMPSLLLNQEHFLQFPSQVFLGHLSRTNHLRIHDKGTRILVDIYETKQTKIFHLLMHICYNITSLIYTYLISYLYFIMACGTEYCEIIDCERPNLWRQLRSGRAPCNRRVAKHWNFNWCKLKYWE